MHQPAITPIPPGEANEAARLEFLERHLSPELPLPLARHLLLRIAPGPEAVIDLALDGERVFLGVVIDHCESSTRSAPFERLAWRRVAGLEAVLDEALAHAEAYVARGPLRRIEVGFDTRHPLPLELLSRRGYRPFYRSHHMVRPADGPIPTPARPLPEGLTWHDLEETQLPALRELTLQAFAAIPGTHFKPLEDMRRSWRERTLPARALLQGDRLVAWVTPVLEPDSQGEGDIRILGRHPDYRGEGLGDHLLHEAMTTLRRAGATRFHLDVVTTNQRALELYRRFGLEVESTTGIWLLELAP